MGNRKGRVSIPSKIEKKLETASKMLAKHIADGEASKLNLLPDLNWSEMGPVIETAKTKHAEAEKWKLLMEEAYRDRDILLPPIRTSLAHSRNLLKALYPDNPKKLGQYGLKVDDTPKVRRAKKVIPNTDTSEEERLIQD